MYGNNLGEIQLGDKYCRPNGSFKVISVLIKGYHSFASIVYYT